MKYLRNRTKKYIYNTLQEYIVNAFPTITERFNALLNKMKDYILNTQLW